MPRNDLILPHPADFAAFTCPESELPAAQPLDASEPDLVENGTIPQHMVIAGEVKMDASDVASRKSLAQQVHHASTSDSAEAFIPEQDPRASKRPAPTKGSRSSEIDFDAFAAELRLHRLQESRIDILKQQQRTLQRALALSARLSRTVLQVQDGLVETLKSGDKTGFANAYHATLDLKDACNSIWNRNVKSADPPNEDRTTQPIREPDSLTFMNKLPAGPRADVLDFLHLLRTNSSFMVDRIKRLNPSQVSALSSSPRSHIPKDSIFSSLARGTSQVSQQKRNAAFSNCLKETAWSLERTTPLSALLCNLYSPRAEPDSGDYSLRLNTWSSTCADLYCHSDQTYHYLLIETLNTFASLHEWRAKPRIDLFLMNLLQTAAFLLEPVEDDLTSKEFPFPVSDPLRTQEAEDFFDSAVQELFAILNDGDGGLPFGALHFGSAVLGKIGQAEKQSSFRGFLFFSWYFREFLFSALTMPESKGMLLHYHVSSSARESILKEVAIRAQSRVAEFLDPTLSPTPLLPPIQGHLEQMVSCLIEIRVGNRSQKSLTSSSEVSGVQPAARNLGCLVLSISDILLLIDMLVPQPPPNPTPWDPFLNSSATTFAAQYRQGLPPLSKIFPGEHPQVSGVAQNSLPISQSSATALVRKLDQVRRDLHAVMDRSAVWPLPSPGYDLWAVLEFGNKGYPVIDRLLGQSLDRGSASDTQKTSSATRRFSQIGYQNLDTAQKAALRLLDEHDSLVSTPKFNLGVDEVGRTRRISLDRLFAVELEIAEENADARSAQYWWTALRALRKDHPLSVLAQNDTRILQPLLLQSRKSHLAIQQEMQMIEDSLRYLEDAYDKLSTINAESFGGLDRLRDKMWYQADVTNSNTYEDMRNVAQALRNMASPGSLLTQSSSASLRGRKKPRSLAESVLQEPEAQTMSIMKAPLEHGGPKKLADEQVDMTRRWIQRFGVDNFCKGEERIHRFCMEIRIAASKLVGESMLESPVLWSSELYFRQRTFVGTLGTRSMPTSGVTRPSSIRSEEGSTPSAPVYHGLRGFESIPRPQAFDSQSSPGRKGSFHSLGSDRWRTTRDYPSADVLSIADSPGRAFSATTADSINSFWSPFPTQPQSAASVSSLPSRPASFINDFSSPRVPEQTGPRRLQFFEELRQRVIGLLLSDLGSPVWSCGSETDTWLADMLRQNPVRWQLHKRESMGRLLETNTAPSSMLAKAASTAKGKTIFRRSTSSAPHLAASPKQISLSSLLTEIHTAEIRHSPAAGAPSDRFSYEIAYEDLMRRFSRQADPILKLDILEDLKSLIVSSIQERQQHVTTMGNERSKPMSAVRSPTKSAPSSRRSSLTPVTLSGLASRPQQEADNAKTIDVVLSQPSTSPTDEEVINEIKSILMSTRPKTLFRDLQFITAFVPSDVLNNTAGGKAFLHVGLAALAFKDDVCRSLVSVADKIMVNDSIKRRSPTAGKIEYNLRDAAQMWILAAKEGNATAQRELATLYLSDPELLPSVSLPLTAPRDIFRSDMKYWSEDESIRSSSQAMCLALHWMRLAASNGDAIAKKRLKEREAKELVR